ncbi:hypothetical protein [Amycolatopsis vastitatis]|uniref:Uncharacterized protein n=1 Tax=Amycolatopsis vastitatis TaxID=1905142 RepID=A0A229SNP8_9PSEU|nr:hypothetical protein [Amycolatopsis vastitatis]OXM60404.1 hypothetical protein CF165_43085 [Amycolatopsis vastitatis]
MTAKGSAPAGGEPFAAFRAWLAGHRGDVSVVAEDGAGDLRWFCGETLRSFFPGDPDLTARFIADPAFRREVLDRVRGEPISTDFPEVPLPGLGLAILADVPAFARDLGVRPRP